MTTATKPRGAEHSARNESDPIQAARDQVAHLKGVEDDWSTKRLRVATELLGLEEAGGDDVVEAAIAGDGADAVHDLVDRTVHLRAELEAIDRVIASTRKRREAAILAVYQATAAQMQNDATERRARADEHEVRTLELLAELEAHEACTYVPDPGSAPALPLAVAVDLPDGYARLAGATAVVRRIPRSQAFRNKADDLERRARFEVPPERNIPRGGQAEASSVDELVRLATGEPMAIGPTVHEVRAWAARVEAAELARRQKVLERFGSEEAAARGHGKPIGFVLTWRDGAIDPRQSQVFTAG